jgi:hypothetical protein
MDAQVGVWLHRLPGERVEQPASAPFMSVFFRPSRTPGRAVAERAREFLSERVRMTTG